MSEQIKELINRNQKWAESKKATDPDYFKNIAKGQKPKFIWIGCSDSRLPLEIITQSNIGEIFVLRNIANQVHTTDLSVLSVLEYAINHLHVKQIVICGNYVCGGVHASIKNNNDSVVDHWLQDLNEIYLSNKFQLNDKPSKERENLLAELNVKKQVCNLAATNIVQKA
ncbi:17472_t:CDS:2 [Dentiscutata erythropus]|uniref:Carbonic anhydrase n=1 Tax=Dentiscutata erythropus TaxID=1348616 RepID=A0A9N9H7N5_9GLOM|nr:17472_t:CDS:2 [Dentiscutata erythropus]